MLDRPAFAIGVAFKKLLSEHDVDVLFRCIGYAEAQPHLWEMKQGTPWHRMRLMIGICMHIMYVCTYILTS